MRALYGFGHFRAGEVADVTGDALARLCEAVLMGLWFFGIVCLFAAGALLAI
jgi:hypothetical protein